MILANRYGRFKSVYRPLKSVYNPRMQYLLEYSQPLFRPPAEASSFIIQVTHGCSHNGCRSCGMYKAKRFTVVELSDVLKTLGRLPSAFRREVKRVFLADGDALMCGFAYLSELLRFMGAFFPNLRRVSIYASPENILKYRGDQLTALRRLRLYILYTGLESGDDELLSFAGKGSTAEQYVHAVRLARASGMRVTFFNI